MTGRIVYRPDIEHRCEPPVGMGARQECPVGTVWQCDCGITWVVCRGLTSGDRQSGGYQSTALKWRRESRRARRKREREGVTPEQVFGGHVRHPTNRVPPPLSSKPCPARQPPAPAE